MFDLLVVSIQFNSNQVAVPLKTRTPPTGTSPDPFQSEDPIKRAKMIVKAVTHFKDAKKLAECSTNLGVAMVGISDLRGDPTNFRDREGGEAHAQGGHGEAGPKKRKLEGATETQLYGYPGQNSH